MRRAVRKDDSDANSQANLYCSLLDLIGNYRDNLGSGTTDQRTGRDHDPTATAS